MSGKSYDFFKILNKNLVARSLAAALAFSPAAAQAASRHLHVSGSTVTAPVTGFVNGVVWVFEENGVTGDTRYDYRQPHIKKTASSYFYHHRHSHSRTAAVRRAGSIASLTATIRNRNYTIRQLRLENAAEKTALDQEKAKRASEQARFNVLNDVLGKALQDSQNQNSDLTKQNADLRGTVAARDTQHAVDQGRITLLNRAVGAVKNARAARRKRALIKSLLGFSLISILLLASTISSVLSAIRAMVRRRRNLPPPPPASLRPDPVTSANRVPPASTASAPFSRPHPTSSEIAEMMAQRLKDVPEPILNMMDIIVEAGKQATRPLPEPARNDNFRPPRYDRIAAE